MRYIILLLLFFPLAVKAQTWHIKREIEWKHNISDGQNLKPQDIISFHKMNYAYYNALLPSWNELIPWQDENSQVKVSFFSTNYEKIPDIPGMKEYWENFEDEIEISASVLFSAKKPFLQVELKPFRLNPENNTPERLISFILKIEAEPVTSISKTAPKKNSVQLNSMLSSGKWFKIKVTETGLYKLSYEELSSIGLSDPANVRIFGWGGQMLPEDISEGEQDDMKPTQIYMNKGSDNEFGPGDFILFYGMGPVSWKYDISENIYGHNLNPWSEAGYYFLTSEHGPPDLPSTEETITEEPDYITNSYDFRDYHEKELLNLMGKDNKQPSGREWYGEDFAFNTKRNFSFNVPGILPSEPVRIESLLLGRSKDTSTYYIYGNNVLLDTLSIRYTNLSDYTAIYAYTNRSIINFKSPAENVQLGYQYNKPDASAEGWLDYITLNARAKLELHQEPLFFRESRSISYGPVVEFSLSGADNQTIIWNISNPHDIRRIDPDINGSRAVFRIYSDENSEYVAFKPSSGFLSPVIQGEDVGAIENQNLHASGFPDMIILTHPDFLESAEKLANHRRNYSGLDVLVTTPEKVYNEFSSGRQDVTAIRNHMRYLYVKAADDISLLPRFLLLLGDGSYHYKTDDPNKESKIITYQSENSLSPISSYVSDDFFALLDEGEKMTTGLLDIGVGRLPVNTSEQAELMVNKIIYYDDPDRMGDWRNTICFIGDDEDYNTHFNQANELAEFVESNYPAFNINKIYLDAYKQVSTPVGQRYPEVNKAVNDQIAKGALIINYTGHGGTGGLAHEKILELNDIRSWENYNRLPLFMTATCEFSRYDLPDIVTAGEEVIVNPDGGGIALLTTTRLVYSGPNHALNERFYEIVFEKDQQNNNYTLGEILIYTKNNTGAGINKRNFTLLGDPAMRLSYPYFNVNTDSINGMFASEAGDTLQALKKVRIAGHVEGLKGDVLHSFNGTIYPIVYDKSSERTTLANDGGPVKTFEVRNSIIYKGAAEVVNGRFSFDFIVPKDIKYSFGKGKLSYYAMDSISDASGAFFDFIVGGSYEEADADVSGPDIEIFMNNFRFKSGGITDKNPVLLVRVYDEHGINTTGNGIGHDITATLNDDSQGVIVLNEYYTSDLGSFRSGTIEYPFFNLQEGKHQINVKVWDVYNNSAEGSVDFVVVSSEEMILENVMNYPNPFSDHTEFSFEHNKPSVDLDIKVDIYDLSGNLIKTIRTKQFRSGYRSEPVIWDGNGEDNNMSRQGVYIYRLNVKTSDGFEANESGKLILIR